MFSFFKKKIKSAVETAVTKTVKVIKEKELNEDAFEGMFWELEIALMENNVAVEVIKHIKEKLHDDLVGQSFKRGRVEKKIQEELSAIIKESLSIETPDLLKEIKSKKPYIIAFVGINGVGKTTSLAKLIQWCKTKELQVVVAAADTFRAAAIEQLEEHTTKLDVTLIKTQYKADSAAVCYDAIEHAKAQNKDVVLIDTAGRTHMNKNLMEELKKVIRISKPDMTIFVGDALTGNDAVEQAKQFNEAVGIDGIILAKQDADEKGGAALSVSYVTKKPILFLGTGQSYENLEPFDPAFLMKNMGLEQ